MLTLDGNGVPDNFNTPVTSVNVGSKWRWISLLWLPMPVTATAQTGVLTVLADTSPHFTPVVNRTVTNTDTAIISTNAVVSVFKSVI